MKPAIVAVLVTLGMLSGYASAAIAHPVKGHTKPKPATEKPTDSKTIWDQQRLNGG